MKLAFIIILIYSNAIFASDVTVNELKNKSPERVLYIGNSYLYYNDSLHNHVRRCLLNTSPSPRDATLSRMPSSA